MATNLYFQPALKSIAVKNDQIGAFSPNTELSLIGNITGTSTNYNAVVISNINAMNSGNLLSIQNGPLSNVGAVPGYPNQVFNVDYLGNVYANGGFNGGLTVVPASTTTYTALLSDYVIATSASASLATVKLPAPSSVPVGKVYIIKDQGASTGSTNLTVQVTSGTINIDGAATHVLSANYSALAVYNNGTTYSILYKFGTVS
jgi:hypothetical protein